MNTLVILDWDDTLFPTAWFLKTSHKLTNVELQHYFNKLDIALYTFLNKLLELGTVIIISNADYNWIKQTIELLNRSKFILNSLEIISTRNLYQTSEIDQLHWKTLTFKNFLNKNNNHLNIISIGDADYEYNAIVSLYKSDKSKKKYYKTIKCLQCPKIEHLIEQLNMLYKFIDKISNNSRHHDLLFSIKN